MPTAAAITAAIIKRTIGLKRMLPESPSGPPESDEAIGVTCCSLSFFLLDLFRFESFGELDGDPVAPPVGSVVVGVPPLTEDPPDELPEELWAPD